MADKKDSSIEEVWVREFTEEAAGSFRESLLKMAGDDENLPIIVHIDSYGGSVDGLANMVETMQEIPNPIITHASGKACSAGADLLSFGNIRYVGPHSRIMIHETYAGVLGNVHEIQIQAKEIKRLNYYWVDLVAKNCGLQSGKELQKLIKDANGEIWMTARQAVKFGIADEVGTPRIMTIQASQVYKVPPKNINVETNRDPKKKPKKKKKAATKKPKPHKPEPSNDST